MTVWVLMFSAYLGDTLVFSRPIGVASTAEECERWALAIPLGDARKPKGYHSRFECMSAENGQ